MSSTSATAAAEASPGRRTHAEVRAIAAAKPTEPAQPDDGSSPAIFRIAWPMAKLEAQTSAAAHRVASTGRSVGPPALYRSLV